MSNDQEIWHFLLSGAGNFPYLLVMLAIYSLIVLCVIFDKAFEPAWGALVPIYQPFLYCKITWGSGWYFLLLLIPVVNIAFGILTRVKLAKAFGKDGWFALGLVFLGVVFMSILAFGEARYQGAPGRSESLFAEQDRDPIFYSRE